MAVDLGTLDQFRDKKEKTGAKGESMKEARKPSKKRWGMLLAVLFWLGVWQLASIAIGKEVLLASPITVAKTMGTLVVQTGFWKVLTTSFSRIVAGFLLGTLCGVFFAALAAGSRLIKTLLSPFMLAIKAVPVASFIILVLLWVGSRGLSVVICFLMVLPVIYTNTLQGIQETDTLMLEMAQVFHFNKLKTLRAVYLPSTLPYFGSACSISMGLAFKSGIAAEVIGLPDGSIGEKLYQAKIYLSTGEVLAWTIIIVVLSLLFEQLVRLLLRLLQRRING